LFTKHAEKYPILTGSVGIAAFITGIYVIIRAMSSFEKLLKAGTVQ